MYVAAKRRKSDWEKHRSDVKRDDLE